MPAPAPADPGALTPGVLTACPAAGPVPPACAVVSDPAAAEGLRAEWAALAERAARNELTSSPEWLLTWWQVYGGLQGRGLRLGLFRDAGRLVGLAPLLRRRHCYGGVLPFRRLEFLASGEPAAHGIHSSHLTVLAERGAEEQVAQRLARAVADGAFGTWDEVVLGMIPGDTPWPGLLTTAFRAAGYDARITETARAPYVVLPPTWEAYLQGLSANGRRNMKRSLTAFDAWAGGTTRLEGVTGTADLARAKDILVRLHHARWAAGGRDGVFRSPHYLRFHDAIMRHLAERGALELLWLCAHGEPVAALYGMTWAGKVYAYQAGRRPDLPARVRAGCVLLALAIRRAIEAGRREFDLLSDDALYKRQLAPLSRPLVEVRVVRSRVAEGLRRAARGCLAGLRSLPFFRGGRRPQ